MKKGIRGHDVLADGIENICKRCSEAGIEYIQLVLERSIEGFETGRFSKEYAMSIKEQLGNSKIAVFGSYINPSSTDESALETDIAKFKEKIKYASVLNPIVVGTETGFYGDVMSDDMNNTEKAYQHLLKTMRILVQEAEKYDVNIGIEGVHCYVINTPQRMKRLIDDLHSDKVKVIFDPVNYINIRNYTKQDKMINDMFELLAEKIVVVHAKDFIVADNQIKNVIPGEGILNYELIFRRLNENGLDIPIISEEIDDEKACIGFENLERIFAKLQ